MGRLRFTLTNIMFWVVLLLSCFLAENYALFTGAPRSGFDSFALYFLTFAIIALLILYYFTEHKKNGLTFDKILLPAFIMIGALLIWTIFRQGSRTFYTVDNEDTFTITFTFGERMLASLQVVIWLAVLYAIVFVYNRFRLNLESYRWIPKIYLILVLVFCIIDIFYEWGTIKGIFAGTNSKKGVEFIFGNENVWALVMFSGILTALILSYKRFSWYYFTAMICIFLYMHLTCSATCIYICLIGLIIYPGYEVYCVFRKNVKKGIKVSIIYIVTLAAVFGLFALFVKLGVTVFANYWKFVRKNILDKDFATITGRTKIWGHIIDLLKQNPLDFIFGLGHRTSIKIFQSYYHRRMALKSAHNGIMEIFLRYGLLGVIIYGAMLLTVVYCLVLHAIRKRYRFVVIYSMAFLALLAHSVSESTNFFTPNVGGVYFGMYFLLPILNILQNKKFKELKDDVRATKVKKEKVPKWFYVAVAVFTFACILIAKVINNLSTIDTFSSVVIILALVMAAFFALIVTDNKVIDALNAKMFIHYVRRLEAKKYEK